MQYLSVATIRRGLWVRAKFTKVRMQSEEQNMTGESRMRRVSAWRAVLTTGSLSVLAFPATTLAQTVPSAMPAVQQTTGGPSDSLPVVAQTLQEVVVTAEKRKENLQDVPVPVAVIKATELTENDQVKITDYYTEVPSLSIAPGTNSTETLAIRGITTGAIASGPPAPAPTVGVMVDDVPFGGTGGGDTLVPDFDPGDLARIEVLRGPQGTLYGASSLGGLLKFVTVDPSTDGFSGRLEAGTSGVQNGAQLGSTFRGSVNVPLSSDLAVRASAFTRLDPGYINDPVLNIKGDNEERVSGGHLAALWRPSDTLSIKLTGLYQQTGSAGTGDVTPNPAIAGIPPLGDLQQYYSRGSNYDYTKAQAYNLIINYTIGGVHLTSLTGYNVYSINDSIDFTAIGAPAIQPFFSVSPLGMVEHTVASMRRVTEELRADLSIGKHFDLLAGGYFSNAIDKYIFGPFLAENALTGVLAPGGNLGSINATDNPATYTEYAAFANLTYHITDKLDIQAGGRESEYGLVGQPWTVTGLISPVFFGFPNEDYVAFPKYTLNQSAFTYLFTPQYTISPDLMVYARLASGFREGTSNAGTPGAGVPGSGIPFEVKPDKTQDYEVGFKGEFFERMISVDTSIYYIDWKDIQLPLVNDVNLSYTGNGGGAKSQGVELSVRARPVASLILGGWVSWDEAVLTKSTVGIYGNPGDPLPNTPRFSGNVSADESFEIADGVMGSVGATMSYVGYREDTLSSQTPVRQYLPAYAKTDLRGTVSYGDWKVNLFVNNLLDRRGIITGGSGNLIPYSFWLIQPRTVGLSLVRTF